MTEYEASAALALVNIESALEEILEHAQHLQAFDLLKNPLTAGHLLHRGELIDRIAEIAQEALESLEQV